jgi:hypothetical protein
MMTKKQPQDGDAVEDAGFYLPHFTRAEVADLDRALGDSLRGEIGMLRVVMRRFFERAAHEADDFILLADALRVLGMSCTRLAKMVQTERSLQDRRADELGEALTRSIAAVLEEMSVRPMTGNPAPGAAGGEGRPHGG